MMNARWKWVVLCVFALLLGVCPAKRLGNAAVGLNVDKSGKVTFYVFGSGDTGELKELPASLLKTGY